MKAYMLFEHEKTNIGVLIFHYILFTKCHRTQQKVKNQRWYSSKIIRVYKFQQSMGCSGRLKIIRIQSYNRPLSRLNITVFVVRLNA